MKKLKVDFSMITKKNPEKSLTIIRKKRAGRDQSGHISVRHQGGGAKRRLRIISTLNQFSGISGKVMAIEYDPNRTCRLALIQLTNDRKIYIIAPNKIKVGDEVIGQDKAPIKIGNRLLLKNILPGTEIHDLEISPGSFHHLIKSAGSRAIIQSQDEQFIQVKLPSKEIRRFHVGCWASIGAVSNPGHNSLVIGQAGRQRHKGIRPTVRGKAMNPYCHPHGGGEGNAPIGLKHPKTKWGKPALGVKTRKRQKASNKLIIKHRK